MSDFKEHPDLADLAGHFWAPAEESRIAHHLDTCRRCRQSYVNLAAELQEHARRHDREVEEKPATFWARQRIAIQRSIEDPRARRVSPGVRVVFGLATAAVLALAIALGAWLARAPSGLKPGRPGTTPATATSTISSNGTPATAAAQLFEARTDDPWSTSELEPFHPVVEWEGWLDASNDDSQEGAS